MNIVFLTRASRQHRNNKMHFYQAIVGKKISELRHSVTIITTSLKNQPEVKTEITGSLNYAHLYIHKG